MIAILIQDGPPPNPRVFEGSEISIGRAEENEVALSCVDVSRRHCKILVSSSVFRVLDLQSRNGTFVNGKRIHQLAIIVPGDEIRVGTVCFYLHDELLATNRSTTPRPSDNLECSSLKGTHLWHPEDGVPTAPAPATLRSLIEQTVPFEPEFDALCIDHFPDAKREFGTDMCRTMKINFLLQYVDRAHLYAVLINRLNKKKSLAT